MGAFSHENFIRSLFLLWIFLLFVSSYIFLPSIDRKVVFVFCNVILFVVIKLSIMENQEPTKIGAAIVIKQSIVGDQEPTKIGAAFDRGNEKKRRVAVFVELVEVENEEEEGKLRLGIDEKESEAKGEKRDEFQEKVEAFIKRVKNQRRMEDLQLVTVSRER